MRYARIPFCDTEYGQAKKFASNWTDSATGNGSPRRSNVLGSSTLGHQKLFAKEQQRVLRNLRVAFTTHDFGSGSVNAFQIILTNTSNTSPNTSPTTLRGNLLTGIFWSFAWTVTPLDTTATGFDGSATVYTSSTTSCTKDIAPASGTPSKPNPTTGANQLNNFYLESDTLDNYPTGSENPLSRDWSAYDYAIGTVGYGLGGFNGAAVDGDDYGIFATGSDLTGTTSNITTVFPSGLIDTSATFWIIAPTGVTSLPEITNFAFAYGSLPDNQ